MTVQEKIKAIDEMLTDLRTARAFMDWILRLMILTIKEKKKLEEKSS